VLLTPGAEAWEPARDVAAVGFVVRAEEFAEVGFFVEADKQGDAEGGDAGDGEGRGVRVAKDDPKAYPAGEEADVHRITDVAVETDDHEALRGSDGSGGAVAGPAEIPDAAKGYGETEDRRNSG